jgi:site-specific recombinase XerD
MSDAPLPALALPIPAFHATAAADRLIAAFLAGRAPQTLRAYRCDLTDFAAFSSAGGIAAAASRGRRLSGMGLYLVVRRIGERAGLRVRPHGLRHAAITRALDLTGGDIRSVQKFSRHKDVRLLQRYDDNREDLGGAVARRLAQDAEGKVA